MTFLFSSSPTCTWRENSLCQLLHTHSEDPAHTRTHKHGGNEESSWNLYNIHTPSHYHTITPIHHHTITPIHHHTITLSHHHTITPSHPYTITLSHHHTHTPSHHHTIMFIHADMCDWDYLDSEGEDNKHSLGNQSQPHLPHGPPHALQGSGVVVLVLGVHCRRVVVAGRTQQVTRG